MPYSLDLVLNHEKISISPSVSISSCYAPKFDEGYSSAVIKGTNRLHPQHLTP